MNKHYLPWNGSKKEKKERTKVLNIITPTTTKKDQNKITTSDILPEAFSALATFVLFYL